MNYRGAPRGVGGLVGTTALFLLMFGITFFGTIVQAAQYAEEAQVTAETLPAALVLSPRAHVKEQDHGSPENLTATIQGSFSEEDSILIIYSSHIRVRIGRDGKFGFPVRLAGDQGSFELLVINPYGKHSVHRVFVDYPDYSRRKADHSRSTKRSGVEIGLGLTQLQYKDPRMDPYSAYAATLKFMFSLPRGRWDLGVSSYFTAAHLQQSTPESMRFFGLNLRFGYRVLENSKWSISLAGGAYYTTTLVPSGLFGYTDVAGPQLFPSIRRNLSGGSSVSGYFKYSPITSGTTLLDLGNREIAAGLRYGFASKGLPSPWGLTFDLADLLIYFNGQPIRSRSTSFGFGYSF